MDRLMYDTDPHPLTRCRVDELRFGDRLPYWGVNVRSVDVLDKDHAVIHLVKVPGRRRLPIRLYPHDVVYVVRAGSAR